MNGARRELNDLQSEVDTLRENIATGTDRVTRTEVRSPVRGTVNKLFITTIGGVIQPGQNLVEIVPLEDTLLVEAKIRPSDRAQLFPGQKAVVKVSAYDFTVHGGVDAVLTDISADTIPDEKGESFYRIRLRTETNNLGPDKPIIPGMSSMGRICRWRSMPASMRACSTPPWRCCLPMTRCWCCRRRSSVKAKNI